MDTDIVMSPEYNAVDVDCNARRVPHVGSGSLALGVQEEETAGVLTLK